jgi:hypothetical protein
MTDGIDFGREVARVRGSDVAYIVDLLRGVYKTMDICDSFDPLSGDSEGKLCLGDFIEILDNCDAIEIVDNEEFLVDAD